MPDIFAVAGKRTWCLFQTVNLSSSSVFPPNNLNSPVEIQAQQRATLFNPLRGNCVYEP